MMEERIILFKNYFYSTFANTLHELLALPSGYVLVYKARKGYFSKEFIKTMENGKLKNTQVLLLCAIYPDHEDTPSEEIKKNIIDYVRYVPLRVSSLVDKPTIEDDYINFYLTLGDYLHTKNEDCVPITEELIKRHDGHLPLFFQCGPEDSKETEFELGVYEAFEKDELSNFITYVEPRTNGALENVVNKLRQKGPNNSKINYIDHYIFANYRFVSKKTKEDLKYDADREAFLIEEGDELEFIIDYDTSSPNHESIASKTKLQLAAGNRPIRNIDIRRELSDHLVQSNETIWSHEFADVGNIRIYSPILSGVKEPSSCRPIGDIRIGFREIEAPLKPMNVFKQFLYRMTLAIPLLYFTFKGEELLQIKDVNTILLKTFIIIMIFLYFVVPIFSSTAAKEESKMTPPSF